MKPIIALISLLFCLLISPFAPAAPDTNTNETYLPAQAPEPAAMPEAMPPPGSAVANPLAGSLAVPEPAAVPAPAAPVPAHPPAPSAATIYEINNLANYPLAPGDSLEISVWKEDGLQEQQYLVSPDGTIIFPLIGTVIAAGKTITELKDYLVARLGDYISDPSITVKLLGYQGNSIFVIGKVTKPGQYFSARKIDVLQALSLAGGLTVYANQGSISVLRRIGNDIKVFPFDYGDVIRGDDLQQNILLEPGDTVTVP
ncbi:MAG: polysaccharide biosynthesis/export family protein [Methylomonas sp.]